MSCSRSISKGFFIVLGMVFIACSEAPNFPDEPKIEFVNLSKDVMLQGTSNEDSTQIHLSFTDGDGNIGNEENVDLFFIDQRDTTTPIQFRLPLVPEEGAGNGISGEIFITLRTTCCLFPNGEPPCNPSTEFPTDTVIYETYLVDRAGNESNRIELPPITLLCE